MSANELEVTTSTVVHSLRAEMAQSPSIVSVISSKFALPTEHSIMVDAMASRSQLSDTDIEIPPSNFHKIVAELMGTYILIFAGCGAALIDKIQTLTIVGIALVWGLVLMTVIYTVGHVSGAHFNPAVTIAFAAARRFPLKQVPMYVLSQLLGATIACLTLKVLFHDQDNIRSTATQYSSPTTDLEAIAWEFIITFFLMFTICGVATDHRAIKEVSGVAIGATLMFNIIIAGPITGASMNPARSIGPAIASGFHKNLWVYVVAPIFGAMAATLIYSLIRPSKPDTAKDNPKSVYNELYLP